MKLGRNQLIALLGGGLPYLMNFALVCSGKLEGEAFWGGSWPYIGAWLAIVLGASAAIKIGSAFAEKKSDE